jgi:hypothetical protein
MKVPFDTASATKPPARIVVAIPDSAGRIKSALSERSTSRLASINRQLRTKREVKSGMAANPSADKRRSDAAAAQYPRSACRKR